MSKMAECLIEASKFNYVNNIYFLCILLVISNCSRNGIFHKIPSLLRLNVTHSLVIICLPVNVFNHSILCCLYAYSFRIYCDIILYKINNIIIKAFTTTYCIASLLLFLIILANISILNPGPVKIEALNCYFQNVQGFDPLNSISKPFPDLCITKILEFQTYVFESSPDIIVLNETWLKPSINSTEILPGNSYKVFRIDRSPETHPLDPEDPKKFKKSGGGVLIAVKNSLNLHPKLITSTAKAEIISIELTLPNKNRLTVSTLYRVGTLGNFNANEVASHFTNIFSSKKYKYNFIVGDMNLDTVNWLSNSTSNRVHTSFISLFNDLGLSQLTHEATHKGGKILDVLLCDSLDIIRNLKVEFPGTFVNSDHSPITFTINTIVRKVKSAKRSIYNFKKANWAQLNSELSRVDWLHLLGSNEVKIGWNIFKNKFLALCNKHIPKIKIKESFHPPWFDSDVFRLNKKKELSRKQFKQTSDQRHYKKYSSLRKQLKSLIKSKMRANFDDELNPNVITKKFWSSVKSTSKSSRILEKMQLGNTVRNNSKEIANLFNTHFYNQFSDSSTYEIDIDFPNDRFSDFTIDDRNICNALRKLNPNKSKSPDNIGGLLLKNCAQSISYPLSILFNISFRTGSLPTEWKMANIVPVYKKGDKNCIENYRPISLTCIVSKIFEKCIRDELLSHCKELIHDTQHGFLPNKSCVTQLLSFSHDISVGLLVN